MIPEKTSILIDSLQEKIQSLKNNIKNISIGDFDEILNEIANVKEVIETNSATNVEIGNAQHYLDVAAVMIIALNKNGKIIYANNKAVEVLEYSKDEIIGMNWFENFLFEEKAADVKNVFNQIIKGQLNDLEYIEEFIRTKTGEAKLIAWNNNLLYDREDNIIGTLSSGEDITEKRKLENEVKLNEEHFKSIVEDSEAGYFFIDKNGIIRNVNQAWLRMYKYDSFDEVIGNHFTKIQKVDDKKLAVEFVNGIMDSNPDFMKGDFSRKCKDGTIGHHTFSARPVIKNDEITGIEGFIIDTTEKKVLEEELRLSKEQLQNLFDHMNSGFALHKIIVDNKGIPVDYEFIDVNGVFEDITGFKKKDVVGKKIRGFRQDIDKDHNYWIKLFGKVALENESIKFEKYVSGLEKWFFISAYSPQKGYFATIIEDITEKKETEQKIAESESLLKEVGEIAKVGGWEFDPQTGKGSWTTTTMQIHDIDENIPATAEEGLKYYSESSAPIIKQAVFDAIEKAEPYDLELELISSKGVLKFIRTIGKPILKDGKVVKVRGTIQDITEQKIAEQKLIESELLLNEVGKIAKIGGWEHDLISRIATWTKTTYDIVEIDYEDPIPGPDEHINYYLPEYQEMIRKSMNDLIEFGIRLEFEAKLKTKTGKIKWVKALGERELVDGKCIKAFGTFQDITEQKLAEQKLIESELLLNEVGKIAKIGGWEHDLINRTAKWTKATYDIVEIDYNDPVPGPDEYVEYFLPEFRPEIQKSMQALIEDGTPLMFEAKIKTVNGKITWTRALGIRDVVDGKCIKVFGTFQDINDKKIAEEKIKKSEALLNEVGTIAKIGGWELDLINRTARWTKATFDIVEIDYNDPIPGPDEHIRYYLPKYQSMIEKSINDLIENGNQMDFVAEYKPPSGSLKWVRVQGHRLLKEGQCVKIFGTVQDITVLKVAEIQLRESEEKFRAFFNSSLFGSVHADLNGDIINANEKFLEIIGYSNNDLHAGEIKWNKITPQEHLDVDYEKFKEAQKFGISKPYEKQYIRKDGTLVWVLIGFIVIGDNKNQALAFIIDIQKIKDYQEELEKRNKFIQTILDNLPLGVGTNDIDTGKVTYLNKEFEKAYGWPAKDFPTIEDFFLKVFPDEDDRKFIQEQIIADIQSGDPDRMKWKNLVITTKKGEKRIIDGINIPILDQNNMISTVRDVTEIRKAEQELEKYRNHLEELVKERTTELEEKNKELERFNQLFVGREFRIKELKDQIKELKEKLEDK